MLWEIIFALAMFTMALGEVIMVAFAFVVAFAILVNVYYAFKESKFYEKFIIFIKEWNGDVTGIQGEIGPDDSVKINRQEHIARPDVDPSLANLLDKADQEGSTIDRKPAVRSEPTRELQDKLNDRVNRGE